MDKPYPENLPVVGACKKCNQSFSADEEYVACLIEAVIAGTTDPDRIRRPTLSRILRDSPALRARIEKAKAEHKDRVEFAIEEGRIRNVVMKLARGHSAFELSQPCKDDPSHFWCGPLDSLPPDQRESFDAVHFQQMLGEVGSRGQQRMIAAQINLQPLEGGERKTFRSLINDWVEVQNGNYRYLAIDDRGGVLIRIVIREYLGCEVGWLLEIQQAEP